MLNFSHLNHFEVALGGSAIRANPVLRNIFPASAGGDIFFRPSIALVVNESAKHAEPSFVIFLFCALLGYCIVDIRRHPGSSSSQFEGLYSTILHENASRMEGQIG